MAILKTIYVIGAILNSTPQLQTTRIVELLIDHKILRTKLSPIMTTLRTFSYTILQYLHGLF